MDNEKEKMETKLPTDRDLQRSAANKCLLHELLFGWFTPIVARYRKGHLDEEDLSKPLDVYNANNLGSQIADIWMHMDDSRRSLTRTLWTMFGNNCLWLLFLNILLECGLRMFKPFLVGLLGSAQTSTNIVWTIIILLTVVLLEVLLFHLYFISAQLIGMKMHIAVSSLLYRNSLNQSLRGNDSPTAGSNLNLLTNDVRRLDFIIVHVQNLIVPWISVLIGTSIMCYRLGASACVGIIFLVAILPLQLYLGKLVTKYRRGTAQVTDKRIDRMDEMLYAIETIKLYGWEKIFQRDISNLRRLELKQVLKYMHIHAVTISMYLVNNRIGIIICTLIYAIVERNNLSASYLFELITYYDMFRRSMFVCFAQALIQSSEIRVSLGRMECYLNQFDLKAFSTCAPTQSNGDFSTSTTNTIKISLSKVSAAWKRTDSITDTLSEVNFHANNSEFIALSGPVGSGKTALLHVILQELPPRQGEISVRGTIAFASQEPWLFGASIRDNIICGRAFDEQHYRKVLSVCSLDSDLRSFACGDQTLVGSRGVTLSGGQRARIHLARAVYPSVDVYLLDNPLAALDKNVASHIFQHCFVEFLANKCRILATHDEDILSNMDCFSKIVRIEHGRIASYNSLANNKKNLIHCDGPNQATTITAAVKNHINADANQDEPSKEVKVNGNVAFSVYWTYICAMGKWYIISILTVLFVIVQFLLSFIDYYLAYMVDLKTELTQASYVLIALLLSAISLLLVRTCMFFRCSIQASSILHNRMLISVLNAPMQFFRDNSSGRILNRFSKDLGILDDVLPQVVIASIQIALIVLGTFSIVVIINPWNLVPTLVLLIVLYYVRNMFIGTIRDLKRIESIRLSPVVSQSSDTIEGLSTLRALKMQQTFTKRFDGFLNDHSAANYLFIICQRSFAFWLDFICVIYVAIVIINHYYFSGLKSLAEFGLVVTQSIGMAGLIQYGIRQWGELEIHMITVERILQYHLIHNEFDNIVHMPRVNNWPLNGHVKFDKVSVSYNKPTCILKEITFEIKSGQRVGIIGRTGAGKSSILSSLCRLVDFDGNISIDELNIKQVTKEQLRDVISTVPQNPTLIAGSIRFNLDPKSLATDEQIWHALECVQLKTHLTKLGLESIVAPKGTNFSSGQKQLICLARAVLRNTKIIVFDEPSSNFDASMEMVLDNLMRSELSNTTVVLITHRIRPILQFDKVLVVSEGQIVENGIPSELATNPSSYLYKLAAIN